MDINSFLSVAYNQLRSALSSSTIGLGISQGDGSVTVPISPNNPLPIVGGGGPATQTALIGTDIGSYTFSASTKTVTISGAKIFKQEEILRITNTTDHIVLYDCADSAKTGTIVGNVMTLDYDTTSMDDTDSLQIIVIYNNSEDYSLSLKKVGVDNGDPYHETDVNVTIDTSNLLADTYYYPATTGQPLDSYKELVIQLKGTGNTTFTIEGHCDDSVTNDWVDITKSAYDMITGTNMNASFTDGGSGTKQALLTWSLLKIKAFRIKVVCATATNTVKVSYKMAY